MTPTLFGRWQTRLLILATMGVLITGLFTTLYPSDPPPPFFLILGYVALFGVGWDTLYHALQQRRWDHDWPAVFQLLAGLWEGLFILMLLTTVGLPGIENTMPLGGFLGHYSLVWLGYFITTQSLMRVLFPRWRFRGGQWWGRF
ncbi:MAG TPA: hypothetical protein V6D20_16390 [Candidatus Obscuribacterales bacterium]